MADRGWQRKYPVGAERHPEGGFHFRLWAPEKRDVFLVVSASSRFEKQTFQMDREDAGYFSYHLRTAEPGLSYGFLLDDEKHPLPDPASRYQPQGPLGLSQVSMSDFAWTDQSWKGCSTQGQILYEMHIGTFTAEGTWKAAQRQLGELVDLGITTLEIMPIAEFHGEFGWGYDGVDLFAPYHHYGSPDDLRELVNAAHHLGLGVILDVVYNHLGPSGNFLSLFSPYYFTDRYKTDWGRPFNLDGPFSGPVRDFLISNARYWLEEFHFDGLRLDATQCVFDESENHFLAELTSICREAVLPRSALLVAENEPQDIHILRPPKEGGYGLDMMWNDDFHHSWHVAITGRREAYYQDYHGTVEELGHAAKWGFLYQGQFNFRQKQPRGTPSLHIPAEKRVVYLQNHDQVANSLRGERLSERTSPGKLRAATMALLLLPSTPLLFQGQEFAASSPFHYFADHDKDLAMSVAEGRKEFLTQFASFRGESQKNSEVTPQPHRQEYFQRSCLDHSQRYTHASIYRLHKDLISLRKRDGVLKQQDVTKLEWTPVGHEALAYRFFSDEEGDRLLVLNLGRDIAPVDYHPNPLLVPPKDCYWKLLLATESSIYGGEGVNDPDAQGEWIFLSESGYFFTARSKNV